MLRHIPRTALLSACALLLVVGLAGCSSSGGTSGPPTGGTSSGSTAPAAGATVTEQGFAFNPSSLTVKTGETVTFVNNDSAPHNVKIDGKELGPQANGESKTWTATKAGSYPFSCIIHPSMTGQVTVQ